MRTISPKHAEELTRREAHNKLKAKSPEQWVREIAQLPATVRPVVGRIIWWDWFSMRLVPERCPLLDPYLKFCNTLPSDEEVIAALVQIGYPKRRATERVTVKQRDPQKPHM